MMRSARSYAGGEATGPAVVFTEPLSFFGGIDVVTGDVIDISHPDLGRNVKAKILVMPSGRGSSSSSSVLAEAIRAGTAPLGIVLARPDPILVVACLVAQSLYGLYCPLIVCDIDGLVDGKILHIKSGANGDAELHVLPTLAENDSRRTPQ